jgi:hypothetical protein
MTTVRISLGGDSFYLHRLVYRNMVGLRARFGAPLTGLNSPAVNIMLLTVPKRRPTVFLRCMSMLFHTVLVTLLLVSLVVFSSTVSIFPIASSFYFFDYTPPPSPDLLSPSPLWAYSFLWIPNQLQIIYHLMINLSVLCLCPYLFLLGVRLGSLPLVLVAGSYGGCVHWTPFSLLILFIIF